MRCLAPSPRPKAIRRPRGVTLLEVLLVLTLFVVIAALVWPALNGPVENQRLRNAGDQVRDAWARARNRAMTTGVTHVFRFRPQTGEYRVERWTGADADLEAADDATSTTSRQSQSSPSQGVASQASRSSGQPMPAGDEQELAEGVIFQSSEITPDVRAAAIAFDDLAGVNEVPWSQPMAFYADGTTTSVTLTLTNARGRGVVLTQRGLTGTSRAGELTAAASAGSSR